MKARQLLWILPLINGLDPVIGSSSSSSSPPSRNVLALTNWASEQAGISMHPSLQFKEYKSDDGASSNWGLELKEPVEKGTVLLTVPRKSVLDAQLLKEEFIHKCGPEIVEKAASALGDLQALHEDNFWIVWKLYQLGRSTNPETIQKWKPWIQAMPRAFTRFTPEEQACLPYYAQYAAQYQESKFQAFCKAAHILGETEDQFLYEDQLLWAFQAVGTRFWRTQPPKDSAALLQPTTELVPVGDMFNHRDPPNVKVESHQDGSVQFLYCGDAKSTDLFITYGQPSNPHRFLVIFGFVPTPEGMPTMWSHLTYPDNPFSADVPKMVFATQDNGQPIISKTVWDAVLYALMEPHPKDQPVPDYTAERHNEPHVKQFTREVLENHVAFHLNELAECREKMETMSDHSPNIELMRQHNAFVTKTFARVQQHLTETKGQDTVS